MPRTYTISATGITVASATPLTLIALMPATGQTIEILRMWISQNANATSAQQAVRWGWKVTAFQSVTTVTPVADNEGDPASLIAGAATIAVGKCGINASAEGAGGVTVVGADNFNALNGWLWVPTPRESIQLNSINAKAFSLQFNAIPGTLSGWSFGLTYAELG